MVSVVSVVNAAAFRAGDRGEEVAAIQRELVSLGYHVSVDGDLVRLQPLRLNPFKQITD